MKKSNTVILGSGLALVAALTLSSCDKSGESNSAAPSAGAPAAAHARPNRE